MEERLIIYSKEIKKQLPLYLSQIFLNYILNCEGLSIYPIGFQVNDEHCVEHSSTFEPSDRRDLRVIVRLLLVNPSKKEEQKTLITVIQKS